MSSLLLVVAAGVMPNTASARTTAAAAVTIVGAGSTFDAPFFQKAFSVYGTSHHVTVNYSPVGSGAGISAFIAGKVDFGASDVPMNATELASARKQGGAVEEIPVALGGVAIAYNLSGIKSGLRLTGPVLAGIFLGRITKWNDPAIVALNPKVKLPNFGITVIHRVDSSGTNYICTDYLSRESAAWKAQVGTGKLVNWPVGLEGQGNDGVAALLKIVPGSISYLELTYVLKYHVTDAALKNRAGRFVLPSQRTVTAAAAATPGVRASNFSIVDAPGARSYPISGFSWMLVHRRSSKGRALSALIRWLVTTGQSYAAQLDYVPLPSTIKTMAAAQASNLR